MRCLIASATRRIYTHPGTLTRHGDGDTGGAGYPRAGGEDVMQTSTQQAVRELPPRRSQSNFIFNMVKYHYLLI